MRFFRRIAALAALAAAFAGCAGPAERRAALDELNPAPMSARVWSRVIGTYAGPTHASTGRGGFHGLMSIETRLDLSGWSDAPKVVLRVDRGYSSAWAEYAEWQGTYTNIPSKRYGAQGEVFASTHAPNQALLVLRRNNTLTRAGSWLILTFRANGDADVDWIGRSGWRGSGELWRALPPR